MQNKIFVLLLCAFLSVLSLAATTRPALALGPWKAQIVDAESKQPVNNVVVLAVWTKVTVLPEGSVNLLYYDSVEVIADPEGRFTIAERDYSRFDAHVLAEPELFFFKPGYGQWRFQGEEIWLKLDADEKRKRYAEAGKLFGSTGVVIEMPPLKTREERARYYRDRIQPYGVPLEQKRAWLETDRVEREHLGL